MCTYLLFNLLYMLFIAGIPYIHIFNLTLIFFSFTFIAIMTLKIILHFSLSISDRSKNLRNPIIKHIWLFLMIHQEPLPLRLSWHHSFLLIVIMIFYIISLPEKYSTVATFYRSEQVLQITQKLPRVSAPCELIYDS